MDTNLRPETLDGYRIRKVRDIDFRRPMKFTREQLRVLERAHDGFCRSASNRLSAEMRSEISFKFLTSDQLPYSVVVGEELPRQAYVLVLETAPISTRFALVVEIPTVLSLISRSLGGDASDQIDEDGMSELEMAVAQRSLEGLVESLSDTWSDLCGLTLKAVEYESTPVALQLVPPSEPTLLLSFAVTVESTVSMMTVLVPWRSVDPVLDIISASQQEFVEEVGQEGAMQRALGKVEVQVCAEAGSMVLPLKEVLNYSPGDTIIFPQSAASGVEVRIEGAKVYQAQPGTHNTKRAVQIEKVIDPSST